MPAACYCAAHKAHEVALKSRPFTLIGTPVGMVPGEEVVWPFSDIGQNVVKVLSTGSLKPYHRLITSHALAGLLSSCKGGIVC